ncbi:g12383 [Coccomyxa viridis]|uniref:G12383 protein n=1 Tax=Coccomyxa viridis TaxID=1274662 RepID=A0ABP1GFQ6_9CHLO
MLPVSLGIPRRILQDGGCVGIGQDITDSDSPCYDFVTGPSAADNVRIAGLTDQGVAAEVASHPRPPPACCVIARPFLASGCGCKERFLNLAANFGHPRAEVIAGYRLLKASSCLNSTNGGFIDDPCDMHGPQSV